MSIGRKVLNTIARVTAVTLLYTSVARGQAGSGQPGVGAFLSAVNSTAEELKALGAEKSVTKNDVHIVSLAKISNEGNSATISKALAKNAAQIEQLRESLKNNAAISSALAAAGVSISQVVALEVQPGTHITVFYQ
jgi:hypothetical protein